MTPEQIAYLKTLEPPPDHWGGLGATHLHIDPRDHDIRALPGVAEVLAAGLPDSVDLTGFIRGTILNQGQEGACVAFSTAHLGSIDDVIETGVWPAIDAETMYHRAGGTGANGVDSRLVLQQALDSGMPAAGGAVKVISSYAFVPQQPGVFSPTLMAALAAGYPCVLALLLPADFSSWESGNAAKTSGYHQIVLVGYYTNPQTGKRYWLILNSWGSAWGRKGIGSVLMEYCEADNLQSNYCFAYTVAPSTGPPPKPDPKPDPVPVPVPMPARAATVTGRAVAGASGGVWPAVGLTVPFGHDVLLTVTTIQYDGGPSPQPDPQPDPKPDPGPQPGSLTVNTAVGRGKWLYASAQDGAGAYVAGTAHLTLNGVDLGTSKTFPQTPSAIAARFYLGTKTGAAVVDVTADDGRTGSAKVTVT